MLLASFMMSGAQLSHPPALLLSPTSTCVLWCSPRLQLAYMDLLLVELLVVPLVESRPWISYPWWGPPLHTPTRSAWSSSSFPLAFEVVQQWRWWLKRSHGVWSRWGCQWMSSAKRLARRTLWWWVVAAPDCRESSHWGEEEVNLLNGVFFFCLEILHSPISGCCNSL